MTLTKKLKIQEQVMCDILGAAREADQFECMGLLASDGRTTDPQVVTAACLLPAKASRGHAEADPETIWRATQLFVRNKLRPLGIWHSHGSMAVFHSRTDDQTVMNLLPGMMDWNVQRQRHAFNVPMVTATDEAALPLDDGRFLKAVLMGPEIPGICASERTSWSGIDFHFEPSTYSPRSVYDGETLHLVTNGVRLSLGVPDGSRIRTLIEDGDRSRMACLYSLVVNVKGEKYAERLTVHETNGEEIISKEQCSIEIISRTVSEDLPEVRLLGVERVNSESML